MKRLGSAALISLLASLSMVACENGSRLDNSVKNVAQKEKEKGPAEKPQAPAPFKGDHSGSLEERVAKLEANYDKNAEAFDFLSKVYEQQKMQQDRQRREEPDPDAVFAIDVARDVKLGEVEGPNTALVTIVEAWDFAWPYCQKVSSTLEDLVKEYNGKVRVVFKNMVVHPQVVTDAHNAGCAAAKQGKFVEFKRMWWEKAYGTHDPAKMGVDNIMVIAKDIGADTAKFKTDMDSADCKAHVQADQADLAKFHVGSTPTFFINGKLTVGALEKGNFKQIIDEKLKIAEASGVPGASYYDKEIMEKGSKQFRSRGDAGK